MKYIFAILMFIAVGIQTFSKWIIVCSYEINEDYIAKNLCVNRKVPGSCCKGKCYLQKKLASDEDQQKPDGRTISTKDIKCDYFLQQIARINFTYVPAANHGSPYYINGDSQEFINSYFQPPPLPFI